MPENIIGLRSNISHLAALLLLLPLSVAAQTLRASWPTAHYDNSRTGFNSKELALNASNVDKLAQVWSFPACKGAADPPAIADGIAYVSADCRVGTYTYSNTLFAVKAGTGTLLWQSPLGISNSGCQGSSPPAVSDGVVYVGSCSGMFAINAVTGARLWQNTGVGTVVDNPLYANGPAVADGMVFFTASDGHVNALYAANGIGDWSFSSPYGIAGAPVVANGMVYVGSTDGVVYGLIEEIGAVLWTSAQTPSSGVEGPPSLANGVVYISGLFGGITALDANTGAILWNNLGSMNVAGTPALAYGMAYVAIEDEDNGPRIAYALDAETGAIVWQVPNIGDWFSVAVANGVVYAVNDGDKNIYALDAMTGAVLAKFGDGNVNSTPVVVGGMVYFTGLDGALHAYGVGGE